MLKFLLVFVAAIAAAEEPEKTGKTDKGPDLPTVYGSVTVTGKAEEASTTRIPSVVFSETLFSRDDQLFHVLDAGINAGQHEGGGKSVEIRRFGFNLDHGGVSGGLKVLVDNVGQNQSTQGHGQGYLGSLKSLSPELVEEVTIIDGPFSPEYGDFSGLGVVHIKQREALPSVFTVRLEGGSFDMKRGFLGWSPELKNGDAFLAYDGSTSNGPFLSPLGYRRDNLTGSLTHRAGEQTFGLRFNGGLSRYNSSGQIPLDEVAAGRLDRFGYIDPADGGRVHQATTSAYWKKEGVEGDTLKDTLKIDGFASRSLFDLFSNFTFFLNSPETSGSPRLTPGVITPLVRAGMGDGIQQHDSRLQEGVNAQYTRPHTVAKGWQGLFLTGGNFHDNQINVGLYQQENRVPFSTTLASNAHVTNGAGYVQESVSGFSGRLTLSGGLRYDEFRFNIADRIRPQGSGQEWGGRWQPKASAAFRPSLRLPILLNFNYGRGISTADARVIIQHPENPRIATTDFYEAGMSHTLGRLSLSENLFLIDRSSEQVYVPDDGTVEFKGPSRAYGFESKLRLALTRRISLGGGLTKVANAYYRGGETRVYVDSAPHFVINADLSVAWWKGWSGSLRMRAINHYRLDGEDASIVASGHTVVDFGISRPVRRWVEFSLGVDNLTGRKYYETQNYFESRLLGEDPVSRIHATPGYPRTVVAGLTFRFGGK